MNIRVGKSASTSARPALDLLSFAFMPPEVARENLRALLIENPKYFGSLSDDSFKAVLHIEQDTTYECLSGVDFNPRLECISATIQIKQAKGYSSGKRPAKSQEFVRFYSSLDQGQSWLDQGVCTLNVSDKTERTSAEHKVGMSLDPGDELLHFEGLPRLRAILSWNQIPPQDCPEWLPVWGNVFELNPETEATRIVPSLDERAASETEVSAGVPASVMPDGSGGVGMQHVIEHCEDSATVISVVDAFSFGLLSPRKQQAGYGAERGALLKAAAQRGMWAGGSALLDRAAVWENTEGLQSYARSGRRICAGS